GPTLIVDICVEPGHTSLTLTGTSVPASLRGPLKLEALVGGRSLGARSIGTDHTFALTWSLSGVPVGPHQLRLVASTFMVPDDWLGNQDYRPLSYCVSQLRLVGESVTEPSDLTLLPNLRQESLRQHF